MCSLLPRIFMPLSLLVLSGCALWSSPSATDAATPEATTGMPATEESPTVSSLHSTDKEVAPVSDASGVKPVRGPAIPVTALRKQILDLIGSLRSVDDLERAHEEGKLAVGIGTQALTQENTFSKARVDHAVLSRDGRMVIGVQGVLDSPANRFAGIDIQQALSMTSIEQSSDVARAAMQSIQQKQERVQTQAETDAPTPSGPVMRMGARSFLNPSTEIGDGGSGGG